MLIPAPDLDEFDLAVAAMIESQSPSGKFGFIMMGLMMGLLTTPGSETELASRTNAAALRA